MDDGRSNNCWVRKALEIVVFQHFLLLVFAFAGKYTREYELIKVSDDDRRIILYVIVGTFVMIALHGLLLFCKPITRNKNPLNCMVLTSITFFSCINATLIPFYIDILDSIIGYGAVILMGFFVIFYASICNERDITRWYLTIFTIVFCYGIAAGILYFCYSHDKEFDLDEKTAFRAYGLLPNVTTILALPFLLPFLIRRRESLCGETIEAALYIIYPWLVFYDPYTRCECY